MLRQLGEKGIIRQVALLFFVGILLTGLVTFMVQRALADGQVKEHMKRIAAANSVEVVMAIKEFPAYDWLIHYWYDNYETLDIEYDASYEKGTKTEEKCRILSDHVPDVEFKYLTEEELETYSPEDQKLYAEIAYSWLITRLDQIKMTNGIDYLFGVVTEPPYDHQFFLFSAADEGSVRGTNYEEVYPIGVQVDVSAIQREAMNNAVKNTSYLAYAGEYMDYYSLFDSDDGKSLLIGMTFSLNDINSSISNQTYKGLYTAVFNQLFMAFICLLLIFFYVLRPLKEIIGYIRGYTETKDSKEIASRLMKVRPDNEIGQLSCDLETLAEEMDKYHNEIESISAERERINTELGLASRIQAATLPSKFPAFPERKEFDIFASMDPAREVGGDFYDFYMIDEDHLAVVIADVSGKGIPAALFMMVSKIMIENQAKSGKSPSQVIRDVNEAICSNNKEEMFVTVWLGILEISTGKLTYTNAGHEYAAVKNGKGRFDIIKERHGFIVGGMSGINYRESTITLEPGSRVFIYTDGVPEATRGDSAMFGLNRMLDTLNEDPDCDPETAVKNMKAAVNEFVGDAEQFDDLTVLCLSYEGPEKGESHE